jgi:predicted O-methyltransferase YrrM
MIVNAAKVAARRFGLESSCSDATGQLLEVLVGQFPGETIGEIGAGCGVGTAWLVSGLPPNARLVTIDSNEDLVESARLQFIDHSGVEILSGDWREILDHGPFAMLFVDVAGVKQSSIDEVVDALRPGGLAVLDDLTPMDQWSANWQGTPDSVRDAWLNHRRLRATEIFVTPGSAVILATRRR